MKISIIYMASGSGTRFGSNKLLADFRGKPLYRHGLDTLEALTKARKDVSLLVVSRYSEIRAYAAGRGLTAVDSPDSALGASYTVKAGIRALPPVQPEDYLLFAVADQPFLTERSLNALLDAAEQKPQVARLSRNGEPGNPVLFSAALIPELLALEGDRGGGAVARRHPTILVPAASPRELMDVDTQENLNAFQ